MDSPPRPAGAFVLGLLGLLCHVVVLALLLAFAFLATGGRFVDLPGMPAGPGAAAGIFVLWLSLAALLVLLGAAGMALLNTAAPDRVRTGALLLLVVAVLSFPTLWGFFVGSLLMFVGGVLGLVWQPPTRPAPGAV